MENGSDCLVGKTLYFGVIKMFLNKIMMMFVA